MSNYVTDPIGDLLTRIRNAQKAGNESCRAPWSRLKMELCTLLKKDEWISNVEVVGEKPKQEIEVTFNPAKELTLKRMSKPGRRMYSGSKALKPVMRGFGIAVLTTSQGLMTDKQAKQKKIGGEVLCTIY